MTEPRMDPIPGLPPATPSEPRVLRPRRAAPADVVRPTRAEINLGHLRHNYHELCAKLVRPKETEVWGVLKADGYGHGAPAVARTLERAKMPGICVALLEEGVELREAGIELPILVMGGYLGRSLEPILEMVHRRLTPVVYSLEQLERLRSVVRSASAPALQVHLKVDTGMARLGANIEDLDTLVRLIVESPELELAGLMSHFACADDGEAAALESPLHRFHQAVEIVRKYGSVPRLHMANTAAMLRAEAAQFDIVRPGIGLFGTSRWLPSLKPVMRVRSEVVHLRKLPKGAGVGYGSLWRAGQESLIATVPVGYADGVPRTWGERGSVLIRGRRVPIVGAVSMDMLTVDVTEIPGAAVTDEVVLLGAQRGLLGEGEITAEEIARGSGTIPWEILTNISRRVPRFYREP